MYKYIKVAIFFYILKLSRLYKGSITNKLIMSNSFLKFVSLL